MKLRLRVSVLALLLLISAAAGLAEEAQPDLIGDWCYRDDPQTTVILLREDGSCAYGGTELTYEVSENGILLCDAEGASILLPCEVSQDGLTLWLPTRYTRISEIGEAGELTGTWKAEGESLSSFVFTDTGKFLEDGVFTGDFTQDPESGSILLSYAQGMFEDTCILYSFDGDALVIFYPWKLVRG